RELDQSRMDWFRELNRALSDPLDDDAFAARIRGNVALMDRLAAELLARARAQYPHIDGRGITAGAVSTTPLLGPQWYATEAAVAWAAVAAPVSRPAAERCPGAADRRRSWRCRRRVSESGCRSRRPRHWYSCACRSAH